MCEFVTGCVCESACLRDCVTVRVRGGPRVPGGVSRVTVPSSPAQAPGSALASPSPKPYVNSCRRQSRPSITVKSHFEAIQKLCYLSSGKFIQFRKL